jgi:hypothetical protein
MVELSHGPIARFQRAHEMADGVDADAVPVGDGL